MGYTYTLCYLKSLLNVEKLHSNRENSSRHIKGKGFFLYVEKLLPKGDAVL